ncbi:MAG TPA: hypothetical protein VFZ97_18425 [Acidimicrobiales bacterium]
MRSGIVAYWSPPLVRMTVYPAGVELGPASKWLRVVVPFWQVRFDEIEVVEAVGNGLLVSGVRFRTIGGGWRIFATHRPDEVLDLFRQAGLDVDPTLWSFRPLDPGNELRD